MQLSIIRNKSFEDKPASAVGAQVARLGPQEHKNNEYSLRCSLRQNDNASTDCHVASNGHGKRIGRPILDRSTIYIAECRSPEIEWYRRAVVLARTTPADGP